MCEMEWKIESGYRETQETSTTVSQAEEGEQENVGWKRCYRGEVRW